MQYIASKLPHLVSVLFIVMYLSLHHAFKCFSSHLFAHFLDVKNDPLPNKNPCPLQLSKTVVYTVYKLTVSMKHSSVRKFESSRTMKALRRQLTVRT